MRVLLGSLVVVWSLLLGACSGGTEDSTLRRSSGATSARTPAPSGGSGDSSASSAAPPSSTPSGAPAPSEPPSAAEAGAPPAPPPSAPPAAPGSCANPKCFGLGGLGGCKATDSAGASVTMGCQDGACACLSNGQTTSTFEGDVNTADDARQLFLTNCDCP